jgi:hypothetical protein
MTEGRQSRMADFSTFSVDVVAGAPLYGDDGKTIDPILHPFIVHILTSAFALARGVLRSSWPGRRFSE